MIHCDVFAIAVLVLVLGGPVSCKSHVATALCNLAVEKTPKRGHVFCTVLFVLFFFFSSGRRHTRCALVTEFRRVLFRSFRSNALILLPPFRGGGEGRIDHVGAHDHAGATPEGGVVHAAVFIAREVPDVQNVERPEPTLQGLAGQAETQRPREHLRKERQDQRSPCRHGTFPRHTTFPAHRRSGAL